MKRGFVSWIFFSVSGLLLGLIILSNINPNAFSSSNDNKIGAEKPPVVLNETVKALNDAYVATSNAVVPSVVSISVMIETKASANPFGDDFFEFFEFPNPQYQQKDKNNNNKFKTPGGGSGVFITEDGYIVTNNHVIENATDDIKVTTYDKKEYKAKLIGKDPLTDLALLKIEGSGFKAAHFANVDNVKIGEIVLAVGNPLGLNSTITAGIVSAIGRGQLALGKDKNGYSVENFIQTDAAINPGNSGGGLFNLEGSLVGINTAIATRTGTYIGYGFAIPIDLVKSVIEDLKEDGKINRGYIGVRIETVDQVMAESFGLKEVAGVLVQGVQDNSAAQDAGIQADDIILEVNGKKVNTSNELQNQIVLHHAGDIVNLTIWRDGKSIQKSVKLKANDNSDTASDDEEKAGDKTDDDEKSSSPVSFEKLGFSVAPLTDDVKKALNVKTGAFITKVDRYSVADQRKLFPNGVIIKVDKQDINSVKELKKALESKKSGTPVRLYVKYKDISRMVAIEIP